MWNEIITQSDIDNLMKKYGHFHDSCVKEMKYLSGAFVDPDLSMYALSDKRILKILIQRQYREPTTIELEFSGLIKLSLPPYGDGLSSELFEAVMFIEDEIIYWGDSYWFTDKRSEYDGTWVSAKKARWRIADQYIGNEEVYITR